jgi:hypothetical protein
MLQRLHLNTTSPREVKNGNGGHRRRHHPQVRNGQRLAAVRALHAARSYLENPDWDLSMAAAACGVCVPYVAAMVTLILSENATLVERVLNDEVSVVAAGRAMKQVAKLVSAYRTADPINRVNAARMIGPRALWDEMVEPAL